MNKIGKIRSIKERESPCDVFYTPISLALKLIDMTQIKENDKVLDPSKGGGVFYDNLPNFCEKDWCEITENKDFFEYNKPVNIIIGNPPFSKYKKWIEKSVTLNPRKIAYIFGTLNLTPKRIDFLKKHGYVLSKLYITSVKGWFGNTLLVLFDKEGQECISYDILRH